MTEKYGARLLVGLSSLIATIINFVTPLASEYVVLLIALRVVMGMAHGFVYSPIYAIFAKWFPKSESATALMIVTVGGNIGGALTMPVAGYLADNGFAGGWPSIFYCCGMASMVWIAAWTLMVRESPEEHPLMSKHELNVIMAGRHPVSKKSNESFPWGQVLRTPCIYAISKQLFVVSKLTLITAYSC